MQLHLYTKAGRLQNVLATTVRAGKLFRCSIIFCELYVKCSCGNRSMATCTYCGAWIFCFAFIYHVHSFVFQCGLTCKLTLFRMEIKQRSPPSDINQCNWQPRLASAAVYIFQRDSTCLMELITKTHTTFRISAWVPRSTAKLQPKNIAELSQELSHVHPRADNYRRRPTHGLIHKEVPEGFLGKSRGSSPNTTSDTRNPRAGSANHRKYQEPTTTNNPYSTQLTTRSADIRAVHAERRRDVATMGKISPSNFFSIKKPQGPVWHFHSGATRQENVVVAFLLAFVAMEVAINHVLV